MTRRKLYLIIGVGVIVIAGLIIALVLRNNEKTIEPPNEVNNQVNNNQQNQPPLDLPKVMENPNAATSTNPTEDEIKEVARIFVERYATYSSDNNFQNLREVKLFATARMSASIDQLINQAIKGQSFYGVTAKVLTVKINSLNESAGQARVSLAVQKAEQRAGEAEKISYQNWNLNLISSGDNWLVDEISWQ